MRERIWSAYVRLMDSRWGYNLFGRVLPAVFFFYLFLGGATHLENLVPRPGEATLAGYLTFLQELTGRVIGFLVVVLFATRKRLVGRHSGLLGAVVALVATFYGSINFFDTFGLRTPEPSEDILLVSVAFAITTAGFWLLMPAYLFLGRHIGVFPEARGLSTSGPYRAFRHPVYMGYLLGGLGFLVRSFSLEHLLVFLSYYVFVAWRAKLEERALEEAFGQQYRDFMATRLGIGPPFVDQVARLLHPRQPRAN